VLLAAAATLAGAAVQSATGFGFALVASPALFAVLDPYEAVTAIAALGVALNVLVLADGGPGPVLWRGLVPLLLAAVPGLALGVLLLEALPKAGLQLGVGIAVIVAALVQSGRRVASGAAPPAADAGPLAAATSPAAPAPGAPAHALPAAEPARFPAVACFVGLTSGVLTTSISVSGPPIVLWLEARGVRPDELRASLAASFLALNLAGVAALVAAGGTGQTVEPGRLLPLLGLVVAGHIAGALAFRRLDSRSFRFVVLGLVLAAGVASAVAGLIGL
jgi:uncharacterized membrane protein YfcA